MLKRLVVSVLLVILMLGIHLIVAMLVPNVVVPDWVFFGSLIVAVIGGFLFG